MSRENLKIMRQIGSELRAGNLRAGIDIHDAWVVFIPLRDLPDPVPQFGIESVTQWMRRWLEEWTRFTITFDELIEAGDSVVAKVRQYAEGHGSGAPGEIRYFEVWTFRAGTVIRREMFRTRAEALEAVGLSE